MFDFFKELYRDYRSSERAPVEVQEEKTKQPESAKEDRGGFSRGVKILIFTMGVFYLFVSVSGVSLMRASGHVDLLYLVRLILLSVCDVVGMICLALGTKKTEKIALVLIVVFVAVQIGTTMLM